MINNSGVLKSYNCLLELKPKISKYWRKISISVVEKYIKDYQYKELKIFITSIFCQILIASLFSAIKSTHIEKQIKNIRF